MVEGVQDRSGLKMIEELRKFIKMDKHAPIRIGDVEKEKESRKVARPKVTEDVGEAQIREGTDKLTSRTGEGGTLRTFSDTTNVGDNKRR